MKNMDNPDETNNDEFVNQIKSNIIKFVITTIATNITFQVPNEELIIEAANKINNISDFVQELTENYTFTFEQEANIYSFAAFQKKTNDFLSKSAITYPDIWEKYITNLFQGVNVTVDTNKDELYIPQLEEEYLMRILDFLLHTPEIELELYMWWITVYAMIINTTSDIIDFVTKQTAVFYGTSDVIRSR